MSIVGNLSRHKHLEEFNEPEQTSSGWLSPAQRKALARGNLGVDGGTVTTTAEIVSSGAVVTIPAGSTMEEALQILADAIDPAA